MSEDQWPSKTLRNISISVTKKFRSIIDDVLWVQALPSKQDTDSPNTVRLVLLVFHKPDINREGLLSLRVTIEDARGNRKAILPLFCRERALEDLGTLYEPLDWDVLKHKILFKHRTKRGKRALRLPRSSSTIYGRLNGPRFPTAASETCHEARALRLPRAASTIYDRGSALV